jgi:hypothetical protein
VYNYLREDAVWAKFKSINDKIRVEMQAASAQYQADTGNAVDVEECWNAWMEQHLDDFVANGRAWVKMAIKQLYDLWDPRLHPDGSPEHEEAKEGRDQLFLMDITAGGAIRRAWFNI